MKNIVTAKKFRYILAVIALVGCTAAFAADGQTADTTQATQSQYTCAYHKDCPYGNGQGRGRGHGRGHHHHGYCYQNDVQQADQQ